jgi:hypothetical protein
LNASPLSPCGGRGQGEGALELERNPSVLNHFTPPPLRPAYAGLSTSPMSLRDTGEEELFSSSPARKRGGGGSQRDSVARRRGNYDPT